ncbi:hypothetical protein FJTKL_08601 [Diaporthe vaccinii]|uniref:Uncharacterized protein n=1 Tax=Diaporthe vaccinii TaxID=105482 RepID=A0ABR4DP43_9PEZI
MAPDALDNKEYVTGWALGELYPQIKNQTSHAQVHFHYQTHHHQPPGRKPNPYHRLPRNSSQKHQPRHQRGAKPLDHTTNSLG